MNAIKRISLLGLSLLLVGTLVPTNVFAEEDGIKINEENFPDDTFRGIVKSYVGAEDGVFTPSEIANITQVYCDTTKIETLKGIEYFTSLQKLKINNSQITELDLSNSPLLKDLECTQNKLKTLNISNNPYLETLYCEGNELETLDISKNSKLRILYCHTNKLTTLDASNKKSLKKLDCSINGLTSLNVSGDTALTHLWTHENNLSSLDVSGNKALQVLWCNDNPLNTVNVSANTALTSLVCNETGIDTLDVSKNKKLQFLKCHENNLSTLDVTENTALQQLQCGSNNLTELNLDNNRSLTKLLCEENELQTLNLANNQKVDTLDCHDNKITTLNLNDKKSLKEVNCSDNALTTLSVANDKLLKSIECNNNNIKALDVTTNTNLQVLECMNNELTSLNLDKNTALNTLNCGTNNLAALDVSKNKNLKTFNCHANSKTIKDGTAISELPDFDKTKVSGVKGGNFDQDKVNFTADEMTYTYDCGNDKSAVFTLVKDEAARIKPVNMSAKVTDQVGMKIYLDVTEKAYNDPNSFVEFKVVDRNNEITKRFSTEDFKQSGNLHYVIMPLAARQMSDAVTMNIYGTLEDGTAGILETHTYTIKDYAKTALAKEDLQKDEKDILEAMLNYGAMTQIYFDYRTDDLANSDIENRDYENIIADDIMGHDAIIEGEVSGIEYGASNLRLSSEIALRHHFVVNDEFKQLYDEGKAYIGYAEDDNLVTLPVTFYDGNKAYVEYMPILPQGLESVMTYKVINEETNECETIQYSTMTYLQDVLHKSKNEKLINLAKAMIVYGEAANTYSMANHNNH